MTASSLPSYLQDQEKRDRWKKAVVVKGGEIARRLENLLASDEMDFRLSDVLTFADLGRSTKKKERLRAYLKYINTIIQSFDKGSFGLCSECGEALPEAQLDEMPWSDVCRGCYEARVRAGR